MKSKIYSSRYMKVTSKGLVWIPAFVTIGFLLAFPVAELIMLGNWFGMEYTTREINALYANLWQNGFIIRVTCSKGTYIRTLCNDIGEKLGCGGCMEELLRSKVGRYTLEESHTLAQVEAAVADGTIQELIYPIEEVLADYPALSADSYGDRLLANGNPLSDNLVSPQHKEGWVRMYASDGTFTGIFQWDKGKKKYYPVKMF